MRCYGDIIRIIQGYAKRNAFDLNSWLISHGLLEEFSKL